MRCAGVVYDWGWGAFGFVCVGVVVVYVGLVGVVGGRRIGRFGVGVGCDVGGVVVGCGFDWACL